MKNFRKILKIFSLACVILLASIGVGIAGGIPTAMGNRKQEDGSEVRIELFEEKGEEQEMEILDVN